MRKDKALFKKNFWEKELDIFERFFLDHKGHIRRNLMTTFVIDHWIDDIVTLYSSTLAFDYDLIKETVKSEIFEKAFYDKIISYEEGNLEKVSNTKYIWFTGGIIHYYKFVINYKNKKYNVLATKSDILNFPFISESDKLVLELSED